MNKMCNKNISEGKYEKLRNYLFRMKEFNEIVLEKGLFTLVKGQFCLIKRYLGDKEWQMEIEYPLIRSFFDTFDSN